MSSLSIETPYRIASLPKPLDAKQGRTYASPVYSLRGTKRKRCELAVGVDGEGVNIYDVQSQRTISSYAIPPQSYLCCAPCSIYRRYSSTSGVQRQTYLALKDGHTSLKRRLVCFVEKASSKKAETAAFVAPKRTECSLREGNILSVDILSHGSDDIPSIAVHYVDGTVELVESDLSKTYQECAPFARESDRKGYGVENATIVSLESARKGILKSREDLIAQLELDSISRARPHLLCRLVRTKQGKRLELYTLRDPNRDPVQSARKALQFLTSYPIPLPNLHAQANASYELHASSGTLYQLIDGRLCVFDLSGTVPSLIAEFGNRSNPIDSFSRISTSSVLTFSNGRATAWETSFQSIQALNQFSASSLPHQTGSKRKRSDITEEYTSFEAVTTFSDLGLVVGLSNWTVSAVQLNGHLQSRRATRSTTTLLRNVIGKGSHKELRNEGRAPSKSRKWEDWTSKVDSLVASDDFVGLEKLVATEGKLGRQRRIEGLQTEQEVGAEENVDLATYEDMWPLPEAFDPQDLDRRKVLYLLSKVFDYGGNDDSPLEVRIPSLKLLEWLALTGLLSVSYLDKAFQAHLAAGQAPLGPGAVVTAISKIDDDFQLIHDLLSLPVYWEVAEVVQALRLVIESLNVTLPAPEEAPVALPAPPHANGVVLNGDMDMANGDSTFEIASRAVENELDLVMNALNSGLEVKSDTLRVIITRLHAFSSAPVTSLMRSMMSQNEIVFFIHILRIELADGGWTSHYTTADQNEDQQGLVQSFSEDDDSRPSDRAVEAIGDLLNCAVDAIGTSGWLVGLSGAALATDDLIDSLKAEISAGLEGCYEASTLATLLMELEKCQQAQDLVASRRDVRPLQDTEDAAVKNALLSLDPTDVVSTQRAGQPSHDTLAAKARARDQNRNVGKYSFDRIRI